MIVDTNDNSEIIHKIVDISREIDEELEKEIIDEEKVFKLRYTQFIKGLYLNQVNNNYNVNYF